MLLGRHPLRWRGAPARALVVSKSNMVPHSEPCLLLVSSESKVKFRLRLVHVLWVEDPGCSGPAARKDVETEYANGSPVQRLALNLVLRLPIRRALTKSCASQRLAPSSALYVHTTPNFSSMTPARTIAALLCKSYPECAITSERARISRSTTCVSVHISTWHVCASSSGRH